MAYRRRFLTEQQTEVPLEPLRGSRVMSKSRASAVHATGDRVISHGHRILLTCGLNGTSQFQVADVAIDPGTQVYPLPDTERVVARTPPIPLTPGSFLRGMLVALPSGKTNAFVMSNWTDSGNKGEVKISVTYDNGGSTEIVSTTVTLPSSDLENGAQPTGPGAAWSNLHTRRTGLFLPADLSEPINLADWSENVTAEITVSYIGSPRVLDLCVFEEPLAAAYETTAGDWIVPMHGDGQGNNVDQLPGNVPVTRRSTGDAGYGAEIISDAAARLVQELGPVLMYHTAWNESGQGVAATETDYQSVMGTGFEELLADVTTAYDADENGWSVSSGANACRVQDSAAVHVMRDKDNVVPVRCYIYGAMSTATSSPTATVRFESAGYSIAEVAIPSGTTYAWRSAPGHLRCGLGAQDPTVLQVRAKCSTATGSPSFRWRYIAVVYDGTL